MIRRFGLGPKIYVPIDRRLDRLRVPPQIDPGANGRTNCYVFAQLSAFIDIVTSPSALLLFRRPHLEAPAALGSSLRPRSPEFGRRFLRSHGRRGPPFLDGDLHDFVFARSFCAPGGGSETRSLWQGGEPRAFSSDRAVGRKIVVRARTVSHLGFMASTS